MTDREIPNVVLDYLRSAGAKGGASRSTEKVTRSQENVAKARAAKEMYRKYPILRKK